MQQINHVSLFDTYVSLPHITPSNMLFQHFTSVHSCSKDIKMKQQIKKIQWRNLEIQLIFCVHFMLNETLTFNHRQLQQYSTVPIHSSVTDRNESIITQCANSNTKTLHVSICYFSSNINKHVSPSCSMIR